MTHSAYLARFSRWSLWFAGAGLALSLLAAAPLAPLHDDAPAAPTDTPDPALESNATAASAATPVLETAASSTDGTSATPDFSATLPPEVADSATPSTSDPTESIPPDTTGTSTHAPTESPTESSTSTAADPGSTADPTDMPTFRATETATLGLTSSSTSDQPSATPSATDTPAETPTSSPAPSPSPTSSSTSTSSALERPSFAPGSVLINEVAWAGTEASASDEWIELWNPGSDPIMLDGWRLTDGGDLSKVLAGSVAPGGFYLLERTNDATVADVPADLIYTGGLSNAGETLSLFDPAGALIDTANSSGGAWPAGSTSPRTSMERHGALDLPVNWATFAGVPSAHDDDGGMILGTPRQPNSPTQPVSSPTPTPSFTPEPGGTPYPPGSVLINEVAWAGTKASSSDEWIELFNPGTDSVSLEGLILTDGGDVDVALHGVIPAGGYFLLERTDDSTVADVGADQLYAGSLSNAGETLVLQDLTGADIDDANGDGGPWPAGNAATFDSMERNGGGGWDTFTGYFGVGHDAAGQLIRGTPRYPNSVLSPTPTPTWIPGRVVINEVLMRPHHDWEGAGGVTTDDEFIELYNRGPVAVNLNGWTLDDYVVGGSAPYALPPRRLEAGEFLVLFRTKTHLALNDGGDQVRLSDPDGRPVDKVRYLGPSAANLSYGRLPDGDDVLVYGLWPTPGGENVLFVGPIPVAFAPGAIVINEIAWAGTAASANDEWIELHNPGPRAISLEGWMLSDGADLAVHLHGEILPGGYFLLERTDDTSVADVAAEQIYTGGLANTGERLALLDPTGAEIDVVNPEGVGWPAGDETSRGSMERSGAGAWSTFAGDTRVAHDAAGEPITGTPGAPNSAVDPDGTSCPPGPALRESCL